MKKGLQSLKFSFESDALTHYGGLFLIQRFCHRLNFRRRLQRALRPAPSGSEFDPVDLISMILFALIVGVQRINKTDKLHYDGFFHSLLGMSTLPNQTTIRRFLKNLSPDSIRKIVRLHDQMRNDLFSLPKNRSSLEFHLDSVVLTLYGKQQGARLGYNPKAKGRRSYHPILCFESHGQEFWHGSLRPGDAGANTGARFIVKKILAKVPPRIARSRIRFLMDAGFFSGHMVDDLDQAGCGFIIVCRTYPFYLQLAEKAGFKDLHSGWGVAEFNHQPQKWRKDYRFVVIRRPLPIDSEEVEQLTLFKDKNYSYSVLVTNLTINPWKVWSDYINRSNIERSIRELLNDLALTKIPTESWTANVAFFQLLLFAYNLAHWFKRFSLPQQELGKTIETLRHEFIGIQAQLSCRNGKNVLILPRHYPEQKEFLEIARKVEKLNLPCGK